MVFHGKLFDTVPGPVIVTLYPFLKRSGPIEIRTRHCYLKGQQVYPFLKDVAPSKLLGLSISLLLDRRRRLAGLGLERRPVPQAARGIPNGGSNG